MDARQDFAFSLDNDLQKLITVVHRGRSVDVRVRYVSHVLIGDATTRIGNVIEHRVDTDERGVVIAWRSPMLPGFDWLVVNRSRRF